MENLLMTTYTRDDLKDLIKECIKEEIGRIKVLPESQKYPIAHLSVKDLTNLLGVSKVTIGQWTKRGILKAYRLGKRVYYKREEIEQVLKSDDVPMKLKTKIDLQKDNFSKNRFFEQKESERDFDKFLESESGKPHVNAHLIGWPRHD